MQSTLKVVYVLLRMIELRKSDAMEKAVRMKPVHPLLSCDVS